MSFFKKIAGVFMAMALAVAGLTLASPRAIAINMPAPMTCEVQVSTAGLRASVKNVSCDTVQA
jgi:hypothetical protein